MNRIIDVRMEATGSLPSDVCNNNCVRDARERLRELLRVVDGTGLYREVDEAPEYLVKARNNLWDWIKEARR